MILFLFYSLITMPCIFLLKRESRLQILFFKKKLNLKIFLLIFTVFILLNFVVHHVSILQGREGYSIFTKGLLSDEAFYYATAIKIFDTLSAGDIAGFISFAFAEKNTIEFNCYSFLVALVFYAFNSPDIILIRGVNSLFFALFLVEAHRFIQLATKRDEFFVAYAILLIYPTLVIRGLQLEQEMFVNYFTICLFNRMISSPRKSIFFYYIFFYWVKIISLLVLISAYISAKLRVNDVLIPVYVNKKFKINKLLVHLRINRKLKINTLIIQAILIPTIGLTSIQLLYPDFFYFVIKFKSYTVMDGKTNIFPVDYFSVVGIVQTICYTFYYYFFAPLSFQVITNGGMVFRALLFEPVVLILLISYIIKNKMYLHKLANLVPVVHFLFYYSLIYCIGEGHITSLMRRRIIVYVFFFLVTISIYLIKKSSKYESNANSN